MQDRRVKVLLVEDNPGDTRLLQEMLAEVQSPGFDLTTVDLLEDATARLNQGSFDVVLLDLKLRDGSRVDTLNRIQDQAWKAPIIVLTGLDDPVVAFWAADQGAQDYLVKGQIETDTLVTSITYAIERYRQEPHHYHPTPVS